MVWLKIRLQRSLRRPLQTVFLKVQENLRWPKYHNQQVYLRKYTNHEKSDNKLLINLNLLDDTNNQPSKETGKWVEVNEDARGTYSTGSQIKFNTSMLKSSLCDYSSVYILAKKTISVVNTTAEDADANNANEKVTCKNCPPFTNCISEINNTQVGNAKDHHVVVPMYNLLDYSDNYSKASGSLFQY